MKAFLWMALALLSVGFPSSRAEACSTASCSLSTRGPESGVLPKGGWRADLTYRDLDASRRLYGHQPPEVWGATDPPILRPRVDYENGLLVSNYHQEYALRGRFAQVDVSYGLTGRLTAVASLPFWGERRVDHIVHPPRSSATHEERIDSSSLTTLLTSGMGDAQLLLRYRLRGPLVLGMGVQVPTGDHRRRDEYDQIADPMSQPGSGSVGMVMTAAVSGRVSAVEAVWALSGSHQMNRANALGYRSGRDTIVVAGLSRRALRSVSAFVQAKVQHTTRSRFLGEQSGSTGATAVSIVPGLRLAGPAGLVVSASLQVPLYQHMNEGQLGTRTVATVGLSFGR